MHDRDALPPMPPIPPSPPIPIVFATRNRGKLAELRALVAGIGIEVRSLDEAGITGEVIEDGDTFADNARKKAEEALAQSGLPTLADDSGLEVDALGGAPGVRSARYASEGASDAANNRKLLDALAGVPAPRTARFRCVLAFARPGAETVFADGTCEGEILDRPRGDGGFGYDPLFLVRASGRSGRTLAELPPDEKNLLSHRGQAMRRLAATLRAFVASAHLTV